MCRRLIYLFSVVLLLGAPVDIANADTTSDLVSHWKLDDGSGTTARDSAGINDGTLQGNAKWANGWVIGAVELDGDDDYVDCGEGTVFNTVCRDVITLAAWVKANPDVGPDWGGIIFRGYGYLYGDIEPYDTFAMYYHKPNERMGFKTNSTSPEWMASPNGSATDLFDGEWHHTASVYDGAEKVIYLDSVEIVREAATGRIGIGEGTGRVLIGGGRDVDPMVIEFGGLIDEARIYDRALTQEEIVAVMENVGSFPYASGPNPPVGTILTGTWANLDWRAGDFAVSHNVYIGDNFDDVNNGTGDTFLGNQMVTNLVVGFAGFPYPDGLVPGTTYYWRIDEVNDTNAASPWKGDIWSFSIPPKTAYSPDPADGAEFVDPNAIFTWTGGYGAKLHTVYIGNSFDDVNDAVGGAPQGTTTFAPGPLESEKVYYWRVDEFDAFETFKGDVWSFTTPGAVGNPQPANGEVDVQMIATLSWTPADNAASHELYFGKDKDAVNNATTASPEYIGPKALGAESYDPGKLAWNTAYHWRVDEVYPAETVKGLVWSFSTADFILVDDFESYDDVGLASNRIFDKWIDGFGTTDNGALVGNDLPPYAEQKIVHGGTQSMIYRYDNANKTSEATLTLVYPRDWTEEGVTKLSLWFRGGSANAAERMYVALNGNAVVYHDDSAVAQKARWTEWVIDLASFADQGVDLANVDTITIGFGTKGSPAADGSTGTMYFDDVRLIR
ncbi:MAG: LamG-like jellyroll fold domain-containing protein [Planctomycetota bacterium]